MLINNSIAVATQPGETFMRFQLSWKEEAPVSLPIYFGYAFSQGKNGGRIPSYVPDSIMTRYPGGYGIDNYPNVIETGAYEQVVDRQVKHAELMIGDATHAGGVSFGGNNHVRAGNKRDTATKTMFLYSAPCLFTIHTHGLPFVVTGHKLAEVFLPPGTEARH